MAHPFEIIRVSAVHPEPPQGGFGDEWDSNAPWIERGLAILQIPLLPFYPYFLSCSQTPFSALFFYHNPPYLTNNIYNAYQFSNDNHISPKLPLSPPPKIIGYSIRHCGPSV